MKSELVLIVNRLPLLPVRDLKGTKRLLGCLYFFLSSASNSPFPSFASRLETVGALHPPEEVDLLALAAEEAARYDECVLEGEPVIVLGDVHLLRRLVRNLLENAHHHGKPPIRVEVGRQGASAILEVANQGAGIAEAKRERVFTPFHRLSLDAKGAGLGLSLVRQIARLHGRDASVAPRPEEPSCFRVSLPALRA